MNPKQISRPSPTMAKSKGKVRCTPIRQFIVLLLTFAVLLNSYSLTLFSSVAISGCNNSGSYTGDALSVREVVSTELANSQSSGYFNDIPDASWKRMQQRARSSVQYMYPKEPERGGKSYKNVKIWNLNNLQPDFTCSHVSRVGGHGDGPKWTCDPHRLLAKKDCLIYSVGSQGQYEWEDAMVALLGSHHCEIHVFDSGNYTRPGDLEMRNIHYHQWGIKSSYDASFNPAQALRTAQPEMLTFQQTLTKLGHKRRKIDILKIHCDSCEW
jgi:hypothetical protein